MVRSQIPANHDFAFICRAHNMSYFLCICMDGAIRNTSYVAWMLTTLTLRQQLVASTLKGEPILIHCSTLEGFSRRCLVSPFTQTDLVVTMLSEDGRKSIVILTCLTFLATVFLILRLSIRKSKYISTPEDGLLCFALFMLYLQDAGAFLCMFRDSESAENADI